MSKMPAFVVKEERTIQYTGIRQSITANTSTPWAKIRSKGVARFTIHPPPNVG
jgi:hypothetical protein